MAARAAPSFSFLLFPLSHQRSRHRLADPIWIGDPYRQRRLTPLTSPASPALLDLTEEGQSRGMAGSMQAADAAGKISALLSLLALRRILTVFQPMLLFLLLLLPFRWHARQVDSAAIADAVSGSSSGKKAKAAVVLRIWSPSSLFLTQKL
ncbi:hypothetical protein ZWY2020_021380 [Hordeum vulgare]|nr:hypothetical protein ZWY2020_021380 [Hordeum vulgare]